MWREYDFNDRQAREKNGAELRIGNLESYFAAGAASKDESKDRSRICSMRWSGREIRAWERIVRGGEELEEVSSG